MFVCIALFLLLTLHLRVVVSAVARVMVALALSQCPAYPLTGGVWEVKEGACRRRVWRVDDGFCLLGRHAVA